MHWQDERSDHLGGYIAGRAWEFIVPADRMKEGRLVHLKFRVEEVAGQKRIVAQGTAIPGGTLFPKEAPSP